MPRTDLPSGAWVEWMDKLMAQTRFDVKESVVYETNISDGNATQRLDAANDDRQRLALWGAVITGWSFAEQGIPIPSQNAGGRGVILSVLDLDDFNALADATQELYDKITANPSRPKSTGKPSPG